MSRWTYDAHWTTFFSFSGGPREAKGSNVLLVVHPDIMGQIAAQVPCNLVLKSMISPRESSPFRFLLVDLTQSALNSSGQIQFRSPRNLPSNLVTP